MFAVYDYHCSKPAIDSPNSSIEIVSAPEPLWRYLKAPYAANFGSGRIRLQTVSAYRKMEDPARRDPFEGWVQGNLKTGVQDFSKWGISGPVISMGGNRAQAVSIESFCLCLTTQRSDGFSDEFGDKDEPAVGVKINESRRFLSMLDVAVRCAVAGRGGQVVRSFAGLVRYYQDTQARFAAYDDGVDIRLSKLAKDKHQSEYRAVWSFVGATTAPLDTTITDDLSGIFELA